VKPKCDSQYNDMLNLAIKDIINAERSCNGKHTDEEGIKALNNAKSTFRNVMVMLGTYSQDRGHQANLPVELEDTVKRGVFKQFIMSWWNYATTKELEKVRNKVTVIVIVIVFGCD
jgi:hypothetical protein